MSESTFITSVATYILYNCPSSPLVNCAQGLALSKQHMHKATLCTSTLKTVSGVQWLVPSADWKLWGYFGQYHMALNTWNEVLHLMWDMGKWSHHPPVYGPILLQEMWSTTIGESSCPFQKYLAHRCHKHYLMRSWHQLVVDYPDQKTYLHEGHHSLLCFANHCNCQDGPWSVGYSKERGQHNPSWYRVPVIHRARCTCVVIGWAVPRVMTKVCQIPCPQCKATAAECLHHPMLGNKLQHFNSLYSVHVLRINQTAGAFLFKPAHHLLEVFNSYSFSMLSHCSGSLYTWPCFDGIHHCMDRGSTSWASTNCVCFSVVLVGTRILLAIPLCRKR